MPIASKKPSSNLPNGTADMSVSIDRIIKNAEKSIKFGDFHAATSACYEGLEAYPNNPRLQALAHRLLEPQTSKRKG